jgi:hypothetical protein
MTQLWILQSNLRDHEEELRAMVAALQGLVLPWAAIPVLPFEEELRDIEWDGPRVFYGSCSLVKKVAAEARRSDPIFFDDRTFRPSFWGRALGVRWLNHDAVFTTVGDLLDHLASPDAESHLGWQLLDGPIFLRPDADLKAFVGQVIDLREAPKLLDGWSAGFANFGRDLPILVAHPQEIYNETRVWMVDNEAVAAVQYRHHGKRVIRLFDDLPPGMGRFAEECAWRFGSSHPVFVLDVAETPAGMKVVEINSFHASGFYHPDAVLPVVRAVSNYVAKFY